MDDECYRVYSSPYAVDAFALTEEFMESYILWILCGSSSRSNPKLFSSLHLQPSKCRHFLQLIRCGFEKTNENAYHNWRHSFDVFQMCVGLLTSTRDVSLTSLEKLSVLLAAVTHDCNHPGTDFQTQIDLKTSLAEQYQWRTSPLERYHCDQALLFVKESQLLSHFSWKDQQLVTTLLSQCIISTDLQFHDTFLKQLKTPPTSLDYLQLVLKASDISNIARPWPIKEKWSKALEQECIDQKKLSLAHRLQVSQQIEDMTTRPRSVTFSFIKNIGIPLYHKVCPHLHQGSLLLDQIERNLHHLNARLEIER